MSLYPSVNFACFPFYNHTTPPCKMKMTFRIFSEKPVQVKIANMYRSVRDVFLEELCCLCAMTCFILTVMGNFDVTPICLATMVSKIPIMVACLFVYRTVHFHENAFVHYRRL